MIVEKSYENCTFGLQVNNEEVISINFWKVSFIFIKVKRIVISCKEWLPWCRLPWYMRNSRSSNACLNSSLKWHFILFNIDTHNNLESTNIEIYIHILSSTRKMQHTPHQLCIITLLPFFFILSLYLLVSRNQELNWMSPIRWIESLSLWMQSTYYFWGESL